MKYRICARPHSAISSESDCLSRGPEFDPVQAPYICGDRSGNIFCGYFPPSADSRRAVVICKGKYVHEVLVNHLA